MQGIMLIFLFFAPQPNPDRYDDCASYALKHNLPLVIFFHKTPVVNGPWVSTRYTGPWHIDPESLPAAVKFPIVDGQFDTPIIFEGK